MWNFSDIDTGLVEKRPEAALDEKERINKHEWIIRGLEQIKQTLKTGDRWQAVHTVQSALTVLFEQHIIRTSPGKIDSNYWPNTRNSIRDFQGVCALLEDGQAGVETLKKLQEFLSGSPISPHAQESSVPVKHIAHEKKPREIPKEAKEFSTPIELRPTLQTLTEVFMQYEVVKNRYRSNDMAIYSDPEFVDLRNKMNILLNTILDGLTHIQDEHSHLPLLNKAGGDQRQKLLDRCRLEKMGDIFTIYGVSPEANHISINIQSWKLTGVSRKLHIIEESSLLGPDTTKHTSAHLIPNTKKK